MNPRKKFISARKAKAEADKAAAVAETARILADAKAKAITSCGGAKELVSKLERRGEPIRTQAIYQWKRIPVHRARSIAEITGIPVTELRPDIWPPDPGS